RPFNRLGKAPISSTLNLPNPSLPVAKSLTLRQSRLVKEIAIDRSRREMYDFAPSRQLALRAINCVRSCSGMLRCRSCPDDFLFHEMFFPTAHFLSVGDVSVIAVIARLAAIEGGFVNLHPNPSLSQLDGRPAVVTSLRAQEHLVFSSPIPRFRHSV